MLKAERISLLPGNYSWTALPDASVMTLPDPDVPSSLALSPVHRDGDARVGNSSLTTNSVPENLLDFIKNRREDEKPVLVLGTGEHVWEPFLLAESLERQNIDVRFSATTRSPIVTGHEIRCAYTFMDHEGLGINNYLYNVNPECYSAIVVCIDTSVEAVDWRLISALKAGILFDREFIEYEKLIAVHEARDSASLTLVKSAQGGDI